MIMKLSYSIALYQYFLLRHSISCFIFVLVSLYKFSLKLYFPLTNSANMVACELSELRTERRYLYFVKQALCNLSCSRNDEVF